MHIEKFEFNKNLLDNIRNTPYAQPWPVVYFLHADKVAYIGETTNFIVRSHQHLQNQKRSVFQYIYCITDKEFNKSVIMDIEASLINHIGSHEGYELQNENTGLQYHNYYQKAYYDKKFESVWRKLKSAGIVKEKLRDIENSDLFKYSPYKALTSDQYLAVDFILDDFAKDFDKTSTIVVRGGAGTGKTVLALYLTKLLNTYTKDEILIDDESENDYVRNIESIIDQKPNYRIALVVPMTSLRATLKRVFKNVRGLSADMVIGPNEVAQGDPFDVLIVDEAHRLRRRKNITNYKDFDKTNKLLGLDKYSGTELDWIIQRSKHQILFYDNNQSVRPSDLEDQQFIKNVYKGNISIYELSTQLRSLGGSSYIEYIKDIFHCKSNLVKQTFPSYEFTMFDDADRMRKAIFEMEKKFKLSRMVAGYGWEWKTKGMKFEEIKKAKIFDIGIGNYKYVWNTTNQDWVNSKHALNEIGCIHTTQGYDLNYVGVIIGPEIKYNPDTNEMEIEKKNYFDRNGKATASDDELKRFIINVYTTLFVRGIKGTYFYVYDKNLREYLKKWV